MFGGESPGFRKSMAPKAPRGPPLGNEGLELGNWEGHALTVVKSAS